MKASLLDGNKVAAQLKEEIKTMVARRKQQQLAAPGLAVILVGEDSASKIYVNNKHKFCEAVGFRSVAYDLPADTTEAALLQLIQQLNEDPSINGILVQLPLPATIRTEVVIESIDPSKDVDGFHPYNLGRLAQGNPLLRPCTPLGIMHLLAFYDIAIAGKKATVVGASNIVGRPMALELLNARATVTVCHRQTKQLQTHIESADLIIVATGVYDAVKAAWLQPGQVVIDVGIHRTPSGKIHGDLDFAEACERVKWITPVPGGIGPMTIATLLQNTLTAAKLQPTWQAD